MCVKQSKHIDSNDIITFQPTVCDRHYNNTSRSIFIWLAIYAVLSCIDVGYTCDKLCIIASLLLQQHRKLLCGMHEMSIESRMELMLADY